MLPYFFLCIKSNKLVFVFFERKLWKLISEKFQIVSIPPWKYSTYSSNSSTFWDVTGSLHSRMIEPFSREWHITSRPPNLAYVDLKKPLCRNTHIIWCQMKNDWRGEHWCMCDIFYQLCGSGLFCTCLKKPMSKCYLSFSVKIVPSKMFTLTSIFHQIWAWEKITNVPACIIFWKPV